MSEERIDTRYHFYFIHSVLGHFFSKSMEYFRDYLWPRTKVWSVIGTYDKTIEELNKKEQYGRETDMPTLPAIILNPSGEFGLSDAGGLQFHRFPNLAPGLVSRIYDPIYQDEHVAVYPGYTRLKGDFDLIILPASYYEWADLRIFLMQMFGGVGTNRKIKPIDINSYIIIPPELYNYQYSNPYTDVSYTLNWPEAGAYDVLLKSINQNETVFPCKIVPWFSLISMSDGSIRYGGVDQIANWRLQVVIEYEVEIPSYMILYSDYLPKYIDLKFKFGVDYIANNTASYTIYDDVFTPPSLKQIGTAEISFGLDSTSPTATIITAEDGEIVSCPGGSGYIELQLKDRYIYIISQQDIDSTSNIFINLPKNIFDPNFLTVSSQYGELTFGDHYIISDNGTQLILKRSVITIQLGQVIEIYMYDIL